MTTHVYTLLADVRGGERHWFLMVTVDGATPVCVGELGSMSTGEALYCACDEIGLGVQPVDWTPGEGTAHATRWTLTVDVPVRVPRGTQQ